MIGVMLLSRDGFYTDKQGSVEWGPASDKAWLRSFITNEIVIVGHNTFKSIEKFEGLTCLPKQWLVDSRNKVYGPRNALRFCKDCHEAFPKSANPTINFGGLNTFKKYPPDVFIVHRTYEDLGAGLALPDDFFNDYELLYVMAEPEFERLKYVKK